MRIVKVGRCGVCGAREALFISGDGRGGVQLRVCCPWRCSPDRVTDVPAGEPYQIETTCIDELTTEVETP